MEKVRLKMLPKGCNRVAISYVERKRVPQFHLGIMTEGVRKMFV